jgi:DNA-binding beta-propeller fold protein YncE
MSRLVGGLAASALVLGLPFLAPAAAQIAVSANDAKVRLNDGKVEVVASPPADTLTIIDLSVSPPKVVAELAAPASVVGPPTSVAIAPGEDIALVTSAMKVDPADATKQVPDDRLSVIDLAKQAGSIVGSIKKVVGKAAPPAEAPKVLATLEAGKGAAGVAINKAGNLALVANRAEGTVSVFTIAGKTVTAAGKVDLGNDKSGPSAVAFTPDGKFALVTRDNDHKISILAIEGGKVEYTKRDMSAGLRPYGIDVAASGDVAVVANIGTGSGDADTISVIDLKQAPPRVVATHTVGQTPEGIKMSPDGKYVAVTVMNGSNKPKASPFFKDNGVLQIYARSGTTLTRVAETAVGHWCQGIAWSRNSKTILVQCMVEQEIQVFTFAGVTAKGLTKGASIKVKGGPAGIRTSEK